MQRAFEAIPANVREAAWVSGLSNWETFRRIELPLAWPGLVSAMALTFAHTLGEFGVILMIGGNMRVARRRWHWRFMTRCRRSVTTKRA